MLPTQDQRELERKTLRWLLRERKGYFAGARESTPFRPILVLGRPVFVAAGSLYEMDACGLG